MKDQFDLVFDKKNIKVIYQPGIEEFAEELKGKVTDIQRVSRVEWEVGGWTVRSFWDGEMALRLGLRQVHPEHKTYMTEFHTTLAPVGPLVYFKTREEALNSEVEFFEQLRQLVPGGSHGNKEG